MLKFLIGFSVFSGWALWARYVYVCEIRHLCQQSVFVDSSMGTIASLRVSRNGEVISGQELFMYTLASDYLDFSSGERNFLNRVGKYLQPNTQLRLRIVGRYTQSEKDVPAGMYENIGLARAALIRDSLVTHYAVKPQRLWIQSEMQEDVDPEAARAPDEPVSFWLEKDTVLSIPRYEFVNMTFSDKNFKNGGVTFTPQLPFVMYADSLKEYSLKNPDHSILINVYYRQRGREPQARAAIRAEAVKKYLMRTKGIRNTLLTSPRLQSRMTDSRLMLNIRVYNDL
jgi:hypothetical protein